MNEFIPFIFLIITQVGLQAAARGESGRQPEPEVSVRDQGDKTLVVLIDHGLLAGAGIDSPDIMKPGITIVQRNEDLIREIRIRRHDPGLNLIKGSQVQLLFRLDIDGEEPKIFIAVAVLKINDLLAVLRPEIAPNRARGGMGYHFLAAIGDGPDPYVQHVFTGCQVSDG